MTIIKDIYTSLSKITVANEPTLRHRTRYWQANILIQFIDYFENTSSVEDVLLTIAFLKKYPKAPNQLTVVGFNV